jgi:ubiquinone/menaquinone biosynthesis C-methylase UbiE
VDRDVVASGFSKIADDYIDTTAQAERLVAFARLQPGERVLDAGCGPGAATRPAADSVGSRGRVIGVDLADSMLDIARAAVGDLPNVEIARMDATELDFPDGQFDAVIANSVVQFVPPRAIGEWKRVTRPGGRVVCSPPWGPQVWNDLVTRFVDCVCDPYRSALKARMPRTLDRPPDPSRLVERFEFAGVESDVEAIVQRFISPDDAWTALYTHGARLFLEALPPDALAEMKAAYLAGVATHDGAEVRSQFFYWRFDLAAAD